MALKPFYNKKLHLGMTAQELKESLRPLYHHHIALTSSSWIDIISDKEDAMTVSDLYDYLLANGWTSSTNLYYTIYTGAHSLYNQGQKLNVEEEIGLFAQASDTTVRRRVRTVVITATASGADVTFGLTNTTTNVKLSSLADNVSKI